LKSTNCYYVKASSPNFVANFKADKVETHSDGTIDVYYNISYKGDFIVTVMPHGDSYRILSNRCIKPVGSAPIFSTVPTGDTELEKLFFYCDTMSDKESSQKMVDAFLADPETFIKLLAKQERDILIHGVLSRNMTDDHPQIDAYRATIRNLLAKKLPDNEDLGTLYQMAAYSGMRNYISATPTAEEYHMVLKAMGLTLLEGTAELLREFCIEDAAGMVEVISQESANSLVDDLYDVSNIVRDASKQEAEQIRNSMLRYKEQLSNLDGNDVQRWLRCVQEFIDICDRIIARAK